MQSTYLFRVPEITKVPLWALRVMPKRLALALSRAKETHSITKEPFHFLLNILFLDPAQASFVIDKLMGLCEVHWLFTIKKKNPNTLLFIQYRVPYELTVKTKPLSKLMIFFPFLWSIYKMKSHLNPSFTALPYLNNSAPFVSHLYCALCVILGCFTAYCTITSVQTYRR